MKAWKWVSEIPMLVKVGVVTGTILATIFGAWTLAPKSASYGNAPDSPMSIELHREQLEQAREQTRALWKINENIAELKGRLAR